MPRHYEDYDLTSSQERKRGREGARESYVLSPLLEVVAYVPMVTSHLCNMAQVELTSYPDFSPIQTYSVACTTSMAT